MDLKVGALSLIGSRSTWKYFKPRNRILKEPTALIK